MYDEPYLETCCRAALHRVKLAGPVGRPGGTMDGRCLERLAGMGLVRADDAGRFRLTGAGGERHGAEIARPRAGAIGPRSKGGS